jgi:hypothetical protein
MGAGGQFDAQTPTLQDGSVRWVVPDAQELPLLRLVSATAMMHAVAGCVEDEAIGEWVHCVLQSQ